MTKITSQIHRLFACYLGATPPADITAVQEGPTSIRVIWTPPSPLGDTTGYRVSYTEEGGTSGSVDVPLGTNSWLVTNLQNGEHYTILVLAIVPIGLSSAPKYIVNFGLGEFENILVCCDQKCILFK